MGQFYRPVTFSPSGSSFISIGDQQLNASNYAHTRIEFRQPRTTSLSFTAFGLASGHKLAGFSHLEILLRFAICALYCSMLYERNSSNLATNGSSM